MFIRTLLWSSLFIGLVLLYIPSQLVSSLGLERSPGGALRVAGSITGLLGAAIAIWSIGSFARFGRGTPAPFDPPRYLVTRGPYRYVRNPMYIGAGLVLMGAALAYRSWMIILYVGILFVITHMFVLLYEEPTLRRLFGPDYVAYCKSVRRWLPKWAWLGQEQP